MMPSRLSGALWVAVSAASFGTMAIFARFAYAGGADVVAVLFLRFLLAASVMSAVMLATGRRWPRGRNLAILATMGGVGYVGQSYSFFAALEYASAGLVALLLYLYPLLVTVLGTIFLRERLTAGRLAAVGAALAGTGLTLGGGISGEPLGVALGLAAAFIYSAYILVGSRVLSREEPLAAATVVMVAATVVFGFLAAVTGPAMPRTGQAWLAVTAIALLSTVVAMVCLFVGMRRLGAADAATLSTLEPVVTFILAAIFLAEPIRANQVLGGAIILGAVVWLARSGEAREGRTAEAAADGLARSPDGAEGGVRERR